jgi:alkyl hydroperoxide reductase subunit D
VIQSITEEANLQLSEHEITAAKAAATIMAMNNIYYRFTHTISDQTYQAMPAKLRMNIMTNPEIDKIIFELSSLAVSAINGCSKCMNAHVAQLEKSGINKEAIQSTVRIASVIHAAATVREIMS